MDQTTLLIILILVLLIFGGGWYGRGRRLEEALAVDRGLQHVSRQSAHRLRPRSVVEI